MAELFPFADYWWFYLGFTGFVLALPALDLGLFHRKAHEVSFKEAAAGRGVLTTAPRRHIVPAPVPYTRQQAARSDPRPARQPGNPRR